jgi:branched-subunit amino acid aminotransferase/4-amino-4-deoxychorismate lyase
VEVAEREGQDRASQRPAAPSDSWPWAACKVTARKKIIGLATCSMYKLELARDGADVVVNSAKEDLIAS